MAPRRALRVRGACSHPAASADQDTATRHQQPTTDPVTATSRADPTQLVQIFDDQGPGTRARGSQCGRGARGAASNDDDVPATEHGKLAPGKFELGASAEAETRRHLGDG